MWILRTALKICFPPAGVRVVLRDAGRAIDETLAGSISSGSSEGVRAPDETATAIGSQAYVECRVQHSTEEGVEACPFHSRPENTPRWLREERFAATWNRRASKRKR